MDISFQIESQKFNYRVCAMIISGTKILAMHDERSPYFYLPGGRVAMGETAEQSDTNLSERGDVFTLAEGMRTHTFEWLEFDRLKDEYFYPTFLKKEIFNLPSEFTIRTEFE